MKRMTIAVLCFFSSLAIAVPVIADDHDRDYSGHRGYKERPYGHRHYEEHHFRGHNYRYRGHWRSWDDWRKYEREHSYLRERGGYYREGGHLMFRFCEPGTADCFYFSIGR